MKIALIGYGKMGKEVEKSALARGHIITERAEADLWIDFAHKEGILSRINEALLQKKPFVIGTTGWHDLLAEAQKRTLEADGTLMVSANFSLGVNLFLSVVKEASRLLYPFDSYDVAGFELHHNQKADSPSGTAKMMAEALLSRFPTKKRALFDCPNRPIAKDELQISSLRVGHLPGTHSVIFDSPADTITLTHEARSRAGFALGAIIAAEWVQGKTGFFTMQDLMEDYA